MPLPLAAIGAGMAGGLAGTAGGALATAFSPVARAERQLLRADVEKLKTGKGLGISEAEKQMGSAGAVQAAQAAQASLIDEARRTGNVGLLARLGQQATQAGAGARLGMEQASQQLAQQRAEAIRERMTARRKELYAQGAAAGKSMAAGAALGAGKSLGLSDEVLGSVAQSAWG